MTLSLPAVTRLVVARLALDDEGASVRAALGSPTSILHAEDLVKPYPALPLIAYRRNPVPTVERVVQIATYTWWVYDDPSKLFDRIDTLLGLIPEAYAARRLDQATGGVIGNVAVQDPGDQRYDPQLELNASWIRVYIHAG